jgi:hypothetical protein
MKRVVLAILLTAPLLLAGCVVTPAYRYHATDGGYYYGGADVGYPYGSYYPYGGGYYPYDGYYQGPWVSYRSSRVYRRDHDDRRVRDRDRYRHHPYVGGDHRRFANRFRHMVQQQDGARGQQPRLARPQAHRTRPARHDTRLRPAPRTAPPQRHRDRKHDWRHPH